MFVPVGPRLRWIKSGSGIVGRDAPDDPDYLVIYFEGNVYGASNIKTFADRVYHAADRMESHYPTIATAYVTRTSLVEIGKFDGERVTLYDDGFEPLAYWLNDSVVGTSELCRSDL